MASQNKCRTYFRITGNFDPDAISAILQLKPDEEQRIGDYCKNGTPCDFAAWIIGTSTDYDVYTENQMRSTISPLLGKIELLQKIHSEFDVAFFLEIVPELYVGETSPCLAPSMDIIDFCHETRTKIDIDMYLCQEKD